MPKYPACYVKMPSNCTDIKFSFDTRRNYSWEACSRDFGKRFSCLIIIMPIFDVKSFRIITTTIFKCDHVYLLSISAEKNCYCEYKDRDLRENGILCERNGTFQKATRCGSQEVCSGPFAPEDAVQGTYSLCKKGN